MTCVRRTFYLGLWAMSLVLATAQAAEGPQPPSPADSAMVEALGQKLRCPVCQGMPIGDSPAPMAQDMMQKVRELASQGESATNIEAYFVDRYGSWVLLQPPTEGVALWVWALPPLLILALLAASLKAWLTRTEPPAPAVKDGLGLSAGALSQADAPEDATLASIYREIRR